MDLIVRSLVPFRSESPLVPSPLWPGIRVLFQGRLPNGTLHRPFSRLLALGGRERPVALYESLAQSSSEERPTMFDEQVSVILQHIALPLELGGLSLAVKSFTSTGSARIESELARHSARPVEFAKSWAVIVLAGLMLNLGGCIAIYSYQAAQGSYLAKEALRSALAIIGVSVVGAGVLALAWSLLLRAFSDNRVGGIGVCLALLGFMMEIYQVCTFWALRLPPGEPL